MDTNAPESYVEQTDVAIADAPPSPSTLAPSACALAAIAAVGADDDDATAAATVPAERRQPR